MDTLNVYKLVRHRAVRFIYVIVELRPVKNLIAHMWTRAKFTRHFELSWDLCWAETCLMSCYGPIHTYTIHAFYVFWPGNSKPTWITVTLDLVGHQKLHTWFESIPGRVFTLQSLVKLQYSPGAVLLLCVNILIDNAIFNSILTIYVIWYISYWLLI